MRSVIMTPTCGQFNDTYGWVVGRQSFDPLAHGHQTDRPRLLVRGTPVKTPISRKSRGPLGQ